MAVADEPVAAVAAGPTLTCELGGVGVMLSLRACVATRSHSISWWGTDLGGSRAGDEVGRPRRPRGRRMITVRERTPAGTIPACAKTQLTSHVGGGQGGEDRPFGMRGEITTYPGSTARARP